MFTLNKKPSEAAPQKPVEVAEVSIKKVLITFDFLLEQTQEYISKNYAQTLYESNKKDMIKQYIKQFIKEKNYYVEGLMLSEVVEKLYTEMAEYSFLSPYLKRTDIEEININAWNDIAINPKSGKTYKLEEHFSSASHAIDIVKRLLHNNKLVFDATRPIVTGYLKNNVRITATHTIIVGEDVGVTASIRFVNPDKIDTQQFIANETCLEIMHSFLTDCFIYGVSQCFAGETGCGKTTLMADIMAHYPNDKRLITIEKSVREFDLHKYDSNGNVVNNVLHFVTHDSDDVNRKVTILDLVTAAFTMHPNAICVAEMKNEEAWEAQEAARTGHTVLTTTHASSTDGIPTRLATLCLQKYSNVPFAIIIRLICEAFPLCIFLKQSGDNKRHIMEIAECIYKGGENFDMNPLWKYIVKREYTDENGKFTVDGEFIKTGTISEILQKKLLDNGLPHSKLDRYMKGEES